MVICLHKEVGVNINPVGAQLKLNWFSFVLIPLFCHKTWNWTNSDDPDVENKSNGNVIEGTILWCNSISVNAVFLYVLIPFTRLMKIRKVVLIYTSHWSACSRAALLWRVNLSRCCGDLWNLDASSGHYSYAYNPHRYFATGWFWWYVVTLFLWPLHYINYAALSGDVVL